jgi:hypothetical protein
MSVINKKYPLEVADIFNQYGDEYLKPHHLCPSQQKAYEAIRCCRTLHMGGHMQVCDE